MPRAIRQSERLTTTFHAARRFVEKLEPAAGSVRIDTLAESELILFGWVRRVRR
jgi:hypothetical protein